MTNVQRNRRCKICDALIPVARLRSRPRSGLCGYPACDVEHKRRQRCKHMQTYRAARAARDPEWLAAEVERGALRYRNRRMSKELAQRAPQTNGLAAVDTFLSAVLRIALGVFRLVGLRFQA